MKHALALALCGCWIGCWTGSNPPANTSDHHHDRPGWATTELMLELAAKPARVLDLIDDDRGLVFIDHYHGPGEDVPEPRGEQHLCGRALEDFVRDVWAHEIANAITAGRRNGKLACSDKGPGICSAGGAGEWDPVLRFYFAREGVAVALRGVAIADEVLVGDDTVAAEHAAQDKIIADMARRPCARR